MTTKPSTRNTAQPASQAAKLPLPHERDETAGEVDSAPRAVIVQAKKDLDAGMVDTDMRATPGLDAERREQLVPTPKPDTQPPTPQPARKVLHAKRR